MSNPVINKQKKNKRQISNQFFTPTGKMNHLDVLLCDENRIGRRLYLRSKFEHRTPKSMFWKEKD